MMVLKPLVVFGKKTIVDCTVKPLENIKEKIKKEANTRDKREILLTRKSGVKRMRCECLYI